MFKITPLKLAWQSLVKYKGRTFLTILGMTIGIAAVIIVMSAGESLKGLVLGQLDSFGSDFIQVEIKVPTADKNSSGNASSLAQGVQVTSLKISDAEAIGKLPNVKDYYSATMGQAVASYLGENKTVNFMGVSAGYINIDSGQLASGRFFSAEEDKELAKVIVIGSSLSEKFFGNQDPLNQNIQLGRNKFKVIGVMKERGAGMGLDFDNMAFVPVETAQKIIMGIDYLMFITVKVSDTNLQYQTADDITQLLRIRHNIIEGSGDDFSATTVAEAKDMINSIFGGITLLLVAIAGISLLVGGVGIMNIMYVSVTERTFEIGLRQAVGAKKNQILLQFLWEAVVVTLLGGVIGIFLGVTFSLLVSFIAGQLGYSWDFILPPQSILIAFGFSALVGLIFGYYPAWKAARLDPINALRHDQ
ncbi:MAG: ABC transporter permease [bacterium]